MVDTQVEINVNGGRSCFDCSVGSFKVETAKANGVSVDTEAGPSGSGGDSLLTYKRRRNVKVSSDSVSQPSEKKGADYSYDRSLKKKRDIILDRICQSLCYDGFRVIARIKEQKRKLETQFYVVHQRCVDYVHGKEKENRLYLAASLQNTDNL